MSSRRKMVSSIIDHCHRLSVAATKHGGNSDVKEIRGHNGLIYSKVFRDLSTSNVFMANIYSRLLLRRVGKSHTLSTGVFHK